LLPIGLRGRRVLIDREVLSGALPGLEVRRLDFISREDLPAQGFLEGVLIDQGVLRGDLIGRVILSGDLPGLEVPRLDFMTGEDLPVIGDLSGIEHPSRDVMVIEATSEVTLA
jgi:hypothetical protein